MENITHTREDLNRLLSYSLPLKIQISQTRIIEWIQYFGTDDVIVSFSGGKDSTVMLDLICRVWKSLEIENQLKVMYFNTGLEFPEMQKFVKEFVKWCEEQYNIQIDLIVERPKLTFKQVIELHGYPVISKEVSEAVGEARKTLEKHNGEKITYRVKLFDRPNDDIFSMARYKYLLTAPFRCSDRCCYTMKKSLSRKHHEGIFVGTLAKESRLRTQSWMKYGCNIFDGKKKQSRPLSFWNTDDILQYILDYNIPLCSIYGEIVSNPHKRRVNKLATTGEQQTGCVGCCFGLQQDDRPNRFERLKITHPVHYKYLMGGGEFGEDGLWKPTDKGIGLDFVLNWLEVPH